MTPIPVGSAAGFAHPALFYRDHGDYLAATLEFIAGGLAKRQPVMVAVPTANLGLIRAALGTDRRQVHLYDMSLAGRNPGRIIGGVLRKFAAAYPGDHVRIIGEPTWADRSADEYVACVQHEALINLAFEDWNATILCPYDATTLSTRAIIDARRAHPVLTDGVMTWTSSDYMDPRELADVFNQPLVSPPGTAPIRITLPKLPGIRRVATTRAASAGLDAEKTADMLVAVTELATNAIQHGGGTGTLSMWDYGDGLAAQVRSGGHIADPLAGRLPADPDGESGRGLLLVNELCDLVRTHTVPGATTVTIFKHR